MADIPQTEEAQRYLAAVGTIVMQWTSIEVFTQSIIHEICEGSHKTYPLVSGLSGSPLATLLKVSLLTTDGDLRSHLKRLSRCMERASRWRNYFGHGLRAVVHQEDGRVYGFFEQNAGQWTIRTKQDNFSLADAEDVARNFNSLELYARQIFSYLRTRDRPPIAPLPLPAQLLSKMPELSETIWEPPAFVVPA